MSTTDPKTVAQFLEVILTKKSPEPGARLKVLLNQYLVDSQHEQFDETLLGYKKFTHYLSSVHSDLVEIVRPSSSGDVFISLRRKNEALLEKKALSSVLLKNDIWRAFTFQNLDRRRFLNKNSKELLHFKEGESSKEEVLVKSNEQEFIEIVPLTDIQKKWMNEFSSSLPVDKDVKEKLNALSDETELDKALSEFKSLLRQYGNQWLNFRKDKVIHHIMKWCHDNNIMFESLCRSPNENNKTGITNLDSASQPPESSRAILAHLLALVSEDDISSTVIPMVLGIIAIKSKM